MGPREPCSQETTVWLLISALSLFLSATLDGVRSPLSFLICTSGSFSQLLYNRHLSSRHKAEVIPQSVSADWELGPNEILCSIHSSLTPTGYPPVQFSHFHLLI